MRFIRKGLEPESFTEWKNLENENWSPTWDSLQAPEKKDLHCALVREQGYICCYCGSRIRRSTSHVEHLQPRSLCNERQKLDYNNMLTSCNCGFQQAGISECEDVDAEHAIEEAGLQTPLALADALHCGYKKANWYDEYVLVSPLDPECASFFRYWSDGRLTGSADPAKQLRGTETIEQLGLNCKKLKRLRFEATYRALDGLNLEALSTEERRRLVHGFDGHDAEGRLTPFCAAIVSVLRQEFGVEEDK